MLDLNFEAKFESGNLQSYERVSSCEYDLYIRPDSGSNSCLWFYFCINSVVLNKPFLFHIIGFSKPTTTFQTEQTPIVRSTSRTKWEHIPKSQCWYGNAIPRHKLRTQSRVLSFLFQFDKDENYFFAFTYPYTYSMLTKFLGRIKDHKLNYAKVISLGRTVNGNNIPAVLISQDIHTMKPVVDVSTLTTTVLGRSTSGMTRSGVLGSTASAGSLGLASSGMTSLSISGTSRAASAVRVGQSMTSSTGFGFGVVNLTSAGSVGSVSSQGPVSVSGSWGAGADSSTNAGWQTRDKRVVLVTARVHSGEVPASFVMHGLLEYLTTNNPKAKFLRERTVFVLVPMINPDGCFSGNYRANASGYDLNRCYKAPSPDFHREAYKLRRLFLDLILSYQGYVHYAKRADAELGFTRQILNKTLLDLAPSLNITEEILGVQSETATSRDITSPLQASLIKKPGRGADDFAVAWEPETEILAGLRLDYVIDLHSHSCLSGGFLFYNPDSSVMCSSMRHMSELVFPTLLARKCMAFGAIRQDDRTGVQLRDTPGSLRRIFNELGRQYCQDNSPYIYTMEVTNSHGPDPSLEHADANVRFVEEADDEDNEVEADEPPAAKQIIYTPKQWLTIGEKIGEAFYSIYSSLPYSTQE